MHEASALAAGGSLVLADAIMDGRARRGVNIAGGLHHAMPGRAAGFCIYNDGALAIQRMLDRGAEKIVYVDLDVHHGDGVEAAFWNDPRVVTVSVHETGRVLFPGTGFPGDVGGPDAVGSAVNLALPPGTGDAAWLRAVHAIVPPLVHAIEPTVLVTQHGCDGHAKDPLAHLGLSVEAQVAAMGSMRELAGSVTEGRWLALGGGGYSIADVVPRSWTHLLGVALGREVDVRGEAPDAVAQHPHQLVHAAGRNNQVFAVAARRKVTDGDPVAVGGHHAGAFAVVLELDAAKHRLKRLVARRVTHAGKSAGQFAAVQAHIGLRGERERRVRPDVTGLELEIRAARAHREFLAAQFEFDELTAEVADNLREQVRGHHEVFGLLHLGRHEARQVDFQVGAAQRQATLRRLDLQRRQQRIARTVRNHAFEQAQALVQGLFGDIRFHHRAFYAV